MRPLGDWLERLGILLIIGMAFGWLGPFGTYNGLGLFERFAFWMMVIPLIGLLSRPTVRMIAQIVPSWPIPARILASAVIVGIPGTLLMVALRGLLPNAPPMPPSELPRLYLYVTTVIALLGIPVNAMNVLRRRRSETVGAAAPPPAALEAVPVQAPRNSPFLQRIPPRLGRELLYIATEDHYLRVATKLGSDLILFRLSDALAELDPAAGQQVHRSYWVARNAVIGIERKAGRTWLVLINGARIPVSRTYLRNLREAGWLTLRAALDGGFGAPPPIAAAEEGESIRTIN
jgi:hypothetical protein